MITAMRLPIPVLTLVLTLGVASPAFAQSGPELSGFVGLDYLGDNVAFGNNFVRERYVGTSPVLGVRVGYLHSLSGDDVHTTHFSLGAEAEGTFTPTYTASGYPTDANFSYFAPYLGYRGHVILRLGDDRIEEVPELGPIDAPQAGEPDALAVVLLLAIACATAITGSAASIIRGASRLASTGASLGLVLVHTYWPPEAWHVCGNGHRSLLGSHGAP
jgi:hypothetical protein